jgi:UDP-N-acetylmuramoylalanine--D-glutamate ligase
VTEPRLLDGPALVLGLGVTGQAVARALVARDVGAVLVDDRPGPDARRCAEELGLALVEAPTEDELAARFDEVGCFVPSPGLPEHHAAFALAAARGIPVVGELDLAATWDLRPCVAVTGTNGKTTVTTLVTAMLRTSGITAIDAGNTELPLVAAIDDPVPEVFVVEASSFRLAPLRRFRPVAAAWLNFAPDHLDVHRDLASYEAAKANLWARTAGDDLAVANADDPVVMAHVPSAGRVETFGLGTTPDWHVHDGALCGPGGLEVVTVDALPRSLPHDVANALAAAATARGGGATLEGARAALGSFSGLPHRVTPVGEAEGVSWFDDSKATAPHATVAAVSSFDSVVLIAGGRNKGLDLGPLAELAPRLRAVVAIGEAAGDVAAVFDGLVPVTTAASMSDAVTEARRAARRGDMVLLSPGCASFDWYGSYAERGDDFARAVRAELAGAS